MQRPLDEPEVISCSLPDMEILERLASFYKVMSDPTRLKLLLALKASELSAGNLAAQAGISKSACSHQLAILRQAKLVKSRKSGQTVFYSLDDEHIDQVLNVAFAHIQEED